MKASGYLLLSALVATSAVSADSQHHIRGRPDHLARLAPRAPMPTPLLGGGFGGGGNSGGSDSDSSNSASSTRGASTFDPLGSASSASAAAASSSSAAAAASSSSAAAAAASSSSAAAASASASASRADAAQSSSIAAAAASSAAASLSSANAAASESAAAAASASAASASRASASAAMLTTSSGSTTTLTATVVATPTTAAPTSSATADSLSSSGSGSGGASKGLIIGVSVAGGVLVLAAFIFLYFKFGTRRFSNFEDQDADIKWPELRHDPDSNVMQPLPARRTGGAGFDMGDDSDNEGGEQDAHAGMAEKGRDSFTASTTALAAAPPAGYAVNEYSSGMDHGYAVDPAAAYYQDHHMYGGHQYGMQTSPGASAAYADNGYGVDPYAHAGMPHLQQQQQYPHGHYQ